jgi:hypothetical protein
MSFNADVNQATILHFEECLEPSIDFAFFGKDTGMCGTLSHGNCSLDVRGDTLDCEGQPSTESRQCTVPVADVTVATLNKWNNAWNILPAFCREDGKPPILTIQVRCSGGPLLFSVDSSLGMRYEASVHKLRSGTRRTGTAVLVERKCERCRWCAEGETT